MNAVVAATPPEMMATVTNVIDKLDQPIQDITQVRVFKLYHADPSSVADELASLFSPPDQTGSSSGGNRGQGPQFTGGRGGAGGRGGGGAGGRGGGAAFTGGGLGGFGGGGTSQRMLRETTITTVADPRTASVIVTASKNMMPDIEQVIHEMDGVDSRPVVVTAIDIPGGDPVDVQTALQKLFPAGMGGRTTTTLQSPLESRLQKFGQPANQHRVPTSFSTTGGGGATGR